MWTTIVRSKRRVAISKPASPQHKPLPLQQKAFPLVPPTNFNVGPSMSKFSGGVRWTLSTTRYALKAPGTPFFLVPTVVGGFPKNTIDLNARQSMLGVTFTGPMIGDFQTGGRVLTVLFDNASLADRNGSLAIVRRIVQR